MPHTSRDNDGATPASQRDERDIVVFWILRDSTCSECGEELGKGRFIRLLNEKPLCLPCADLDHLVFLPAGDATLTRRATKYATLRAVVVRFSRARERYERQGILADQSAIERAEVECLADADVRERVRERAAERRQALDDRYVAQFAERLGVLFPGCPAEERQAIAEHACLKYSDRIGRSAAAKEFDPTAIELAVRAHVRHVHTPYDGLLAKGRDRDAARAAVREAAEAVLERWRRRDA